ncbi:hypothetical protein [Halomonas saccharevitans]|uniref:Lipoprotein n=2 Tax=Halomonas saccharevitans TaxID=416872 RepID=A0A1I6YT52_9GAMM|nr:hypothetical protein [Halomonas saccharevitans]SFT53623.1 hypothetical protein SAMN04487956_1074 [Halomonas saccharevitans]
MQARFRAIGIGVVLMWLAGCGGSEEEMANGPDDPAPVAEMAEETPDPAPEPTPEVAPFDEPVTIDLASRLGSDRRLTVEGETNLPADTRLQVLVERELSGVRWRERVSVAEGGFVAGPFGPGSGLPDGDYLVVVEVQEGSVQPAEVRARLGDGNQHLQGPLVAQSRHGLGQVARYTKRFLIGDETRRTQDRVDVMEIE